MKKSVVQDLNRQQRQFGFLAGDTLFEDYSRNDGINPGEDYNVSLISGILKALPTFSNAQKTLIYEQLIRSGFTP